MSDNRSAPPTGAVWFLQNACPHVDEALAGDIIQRYREGKTRGWFWRQVMIAFAVAVLVEIRPRLWPALCYAIAATAIFMALGSSLNRAALRFSWWTLQWPWSQVVLEMGPLVVVALAALPVLVVALLIKRAFRWSYLVLIGLINLGLITLYHFLTDIFPWLLRPVPGDPHHRMFIIPGLEFLLFFAAFLIPALFIPSEKVSPKAQYTPQIQ